MKDIPSDALGEILRRLVCEADRLRFRWVGKTIREALAVLVEPVKPQLPWLLCSVSGTPTFFCLECGDGENMAIHTARLEERVREGRWFGSYEGRCLFFQTGDDNVLLNFRLNQQYKLPNMAARQFGSSFPITMLAATLSSSPDEEYFGAAIVSSAPSPKFFPRQVIFWRKGDEIATDPMLWYYKEWRNTMLKYEDLIYYKESFYVLTSREEISVWAPELQVDNCLKWKQRHLGINHADRLIHTEQDQRRYLVESRGDLLMVIKHYDPNTQETTSVKMYQMTTKTPDAQERCQAIKWVEVSLGGRALFVGRGSSRAYELVNFPGFGEGVYFLDDHTTFHNAGDPQFRTVLDSGKCCILGGVITRCFSPDQPTSCYTGSVWIPS